MPHSKPLLILLLSLTLLWNHLPPLPPQSPSATSPDQSDIHLLSSSPTGLTFEILLPTQNLTLNQVTSTGKTYTQVSIPGWAATSQPGAPALPYQVVEIGAPFGVGISVQVTPGKSRRLALGAGVLPASRQEVHWAPDPASENRPSLTLTTAEDPAIYSSTTYPGKLAEIVNDGILRQQRVVSIASYPLQVQPLTGDLILYESLHIEVIFTGSASLLSSTQRPESAEYDSLLRRDLLNGPLASQWRQPASLPSPRMGRGAGVRGEAGALPWTPPDPGWRINIDREGFYRLAYVDLQSAGLPVDDLDPRTFQLFNRGSEAAIEVIGESDGRFDPADSIVFYGQAVDSKYTSNNVYWLTYGPAYSPPLGPPGGPATGLRMAARDGAPGSAQAAESFPAHQHLEENHYYIPGMPGDDRLERWIWDYLYPPSRPQWSHSFLLADPTPGPARLRIALLGYMQAPTNPDHHVAIHLNGAQVGDAYWDGKTWQIVEIDLPAGVLKPGKNSLTVVCPNDTGAGYDLVYVDWADLEFASGFTADGDALPFTYAQAGAWKFTIAGFEADQLSVYDVSDPLRVVKIENVSALPAGLQFSAQFQDEIASPAAYWALADSSLLSVHSIEPGAPSDLLDPGNGADYILIAPRAFLTSTLALRDFRLSQGLRAQLVDVQDIYDQFGYGLAGPESIHDFLAYAYQFWQAPAPSYVVLVGDGHYDPKDYTGYGRPSYIPPFLSVVDPWIGETAADNRYVTLAGEDNLPEMMLGRLSVNTPQEVSALVEKIISYEQNPAPQAWQGRILAVADRLDGLLDFPRQSADLLACCLPLPYQAHSVSLGVTHPDLQAARQAIQSEIAGGKLLVNYIGHASAVSWSAEGLLKTSDIPLLQNTEKLPVVLAMTCWDGYYQDPSPLEMGRESLAEVITREPGKGAVASWSPTGVGLASGHQTLNQGFYHAVFQDNLRSLGEATTAGKLDLWSTGADLDLLDTFLLFGDPATQIQAHPLWHIFLPTVEN